MSRQVRGVDSEAAGTIDETFCIQLLCGNNMVVVDCTIILSSVIAQ